MLEESRWNYLLVRLPMHLGKVIVLLNIYQLFKTYFGSFFNSMAIFYFIALAFFYSNLINLSYIFRRLI